MYISKIRSQNELGEKRHDRATLLKNILLMKEITIFFHNDFLFYKLRSLAIYNVLHEMTIYFENERRFIDKLGLFIFVKYIIQIPYKNIYLKCPYFTLTHFFELYGTDGIDGY